MLGSQTTRSTGIHVSDDAVHAVELVRRRRQVSLSRCLSARLDEPLALPEALANERTRSELVRVLRTLERSGLSRARPTFGLAGPGAFVKRRVRLPRDRTASHEHLLWEAQQFLEEDFDDYVVDTLVTARHGFVIAARREILELYGVLCAEAGYEAPGFDMVPFALCNALEATGGGGEGPEIILQCGAGVTRAVLLLDGDFEAEATWQTADAGTGGEALRRACATSWGETRAARAWLSGDAPAPEALTDVTDHIEDLDPFAGLSVGERARSQLGDDPGRSRVFGVAAGLAHRGLAEA